MRRFLLGFEIAIWVYAIILLIDAVQHPPQKMFLRFLNCALTPPVVISETEYAHPVRSPFRWLIAVPPTNLYFGTWQEQVCGMRGGPMNAVHWEVSKPDIFWAVMRIITTIVVAAAAILGVRLLRASGKQKYRGFEMTPQQT